MGVGRVMVPLHGEVNLIGRHYGWGSSIAVVGHGISLDSYVYNTVDSGATNTEFSFPRACGPGNAVRTTHHASAGLGGCFKGIPVSSRRCTGASVPEETSEAFTFILGDSPSGYLV